MAPKAFQASKEAIVGLSLHRQVFSGYTSGEEPRLQVAVLEDPDHPQGYRVLAADTDPHSHEFIDNDAEVVEPSSPEEVTREVTRIVDAIPIAELYRLRVAGDVAKIISANLANSDGSANGAVALELVSMGHHEVVGWIRDGNNHPGNLGLSPLIAV